MRVVSLLPATTEIVAALGHQGDLVGRSHECDHPPGVEDLPVVSRPRREPVGTSADIHRGVVDLLQGVLSIYQVDAAALAATDADLVLTQDLCRVCAVSKEEVVTAAREVLDRPVEVLTCSPLTLSEVLDDIERVAGALGDPEAGKRLRGELETGFDQVRSGAPSTGDRPRVAVLEWTEPVMGCGNWAPELVRIAGGDPVLATPGGHTRPSRSRPTSPPLTPMSSWSLPAATPWTAPCRSCRCSRSCKDGETCGPSATDAWPSWTGRPT